MKSLLLISMIMFTSNVGHSKETAEHRQANSQIDAMQKAWGSALYGAIDRAGTSIESGANTEEALKTALEEALQITFNTQIEINLLHENIAHLDSQNVRNHLAHFEKQNVEVNHHLIEKGIAYLPKEYAAYNSLSGKGVHLNEVEIRGNKAERDGERIFNAVGSVVCAHAHGDAESLGCGLFIMPIPYLMARAVSLPFQGIHYFVDSANLAANAQIKRVMANEELKQFYINTEQ